MSIFVATVINIESCDTLHIVKFDAYGVTLSMMSLDLAQNIKLGTKVKLVVKPSHIAIAKNLSGDVSYSNRLHSTILSIENGKLLSSIELRFFDTIFESIITVESSLKMNLKVGESVEAFIKASELSISEVLYD